METIEYMKTFASIETESGEYTIIRNASNEYVVIGAVFKVFADSDQVLDFIGSPTKIRVRSVFEKM